jgi:hypothetical protein
LANIRARPIWREPAESVRLDPASAHPGGRRISIRHSREPLPRRLNTSRFRAFQAGVDQLYDLYSLRLADSNPVPIDASSPTVSRQTRTTGETQSLGTEGAPYASRSSFRVESLDARGLALSRASQRPKPIEDDQPIRSYVGRSSSPPDWIGGRGRKSGFREWASFLMTPGQSDGGCPHIFCSSDIG